MLNHLVLKRSLFVVLVLLFSCKESSIESVGVVDAKEVPTITNTNMDIHNYKDSVLQYRFQAPLVERFSLIEEPYMLFKEGIEIEMYDATTKEVQTHLVADYARYDENKKVWEARGNVVGKNSEGKTLYTEQIFWDEKEERVYSKVKTKVVDGEEVTIGSGFESDDKLENIEFKQTIGRILVDTTKNSDTTVVEIEQ